MCDDGGSCSLWWCVKATSFVVNETRLFIFVVFEVLLGFLEGLLKLLMIQFDIVSWDQHIGAFWLEWWLWSIVDVSRSSQLIVSDSVVGRLSLVSLLKKEKIRTLLLTFSPSSTTNWLVTMSMVISWTFYANNNDGEEFREHPKDSRKR